MISASQSHNRTHPCILDWISSCPKVVKVSLTAWMIFPLPLGIFYCWKLFLKEWQTTCTFHKTKIKHLKFSDSINQSNVSVQLPSWFKPFITSSYLLMWVSFCLCPSLCQILMYNRDQYVFLFCKYIWIRMH